MVTHRSKKLPCKAVIFLIHPCCFEVLPEEQIRKDNLFLFLHIEESLKKRWLARLRQRPAQTLFAQLGGPEYLTEAGVANLGPEYTLRFTTPFPASGSLHEYYEGLASEFHRHIETHDLAIDLDLVSSELWGESFEGCVPGYGGAFAQYLPLEQPPVMRFEMTLHDSSFLHDHRRHEVVPIPGTDIEAWLFECHDGTAAAMFQARRHAQWIDRRRISLRLDDRRIQVCTKLGHTVWPDEPWEKGKPEHILDFSLELSECIWRWIRSIRMPFDEFRDVISGAMVSEPATHDWPATHKEKTA